MTWRSIPAWLKFLRLKRSQERLEALIEWLRLRNRSRDAGLVMGHALIRLLANPVEEAEPERQEMGDSSRVRIRKVIIGN